MQPLEILRECNGYYERKGSGPLVGYAGRDKLGRQYVGEVYANFAKIERDGRALSQIAGQLISRFPDLTIVSGFCGAPEGGKALAVILAAMLGRSFIFPEKDIISLKTLSSREISSLTWKRHEPSLNESYLIVEDVCNNFSTTKEMIELIETRGANVAGILCFLNRSLNFDDVFTFEGVTYPIFSLVRKPIKEYSQDDEYVINDVKAGNVVWKPKDEWSRLMACSR